MNKANLERYKGIFEYSFRKLGDTLGVFADAFMDQPEIKALKKLNQSLDKKSET